MSHSTDPDHGRRALLRGCVLSVLFVPFATLAVDIAARGRGPTRIDVRARGASGDGSQDDTAAFQSAIDALPAAGGTVHVPAGDYLIDPVRSVRLRSSMHLELAPGARLLARANAADRAYVLTVQGVNDVEISGGRIIGERDAHLGTTGEWGHGIMIRGASAVTVRDVHVSHCWGDGISIGGLKSAGTVTPSRDVVIARVQCVGNRRQGLTIGRSRQVRVHDSSFTDTGGTLPGCGIDIEPDAGDIASDVVIANCQVMRNKGAGIQLFKRVTNVTIRDCTIEGNRGHGVLAVAAADCQIMGNQIQQNGLGGIGLRPGTQDVTVSRNEFADNGPAYSTKTKEALPRNRHVSVAERTQSIRVDSDNRYRN
ncbi:right-handed parallel beta-helix repeat-containing protein [Lysobacter sp. S4-A87]|uniref:right-handed parallel beta-helix repeat-containing protein n=1 Tax=Lysobacter sp. S4-A87 TaxID=2925843 RepID=UPI001F53D9E9|nr:right-handed parallel beta-helix repeat-containing protein [Lysobacter sp. S4-A87]UNK49945.1 right-handed parallel beta-helix repeat-containing protein [Lysobacter sp. S4-A87]